MHCRKKIAGTRIPGGQVVVSLLSHEHKKEAISPTHHYIFYFQKRSRQVRTDINEHSHAYYTAYT